MRVYAFLAVFLILASMCVSAGEWDMFNQFPDHIAWDGVPFPVVGGLAQANSSIYEAGSFSSPAVANGFVYVEGEHSIYQLNASNVSQTIASYNLGSDYLDYSSPVIANGYLYADSAFGYVYQLNASNITQLISLINSGSFSGSGLYASPAVSGGYVYVGTSSGSSALCQLNASDISQPHTCTLPFPSFNAHNSGSEVYVRSSPAVANGSIYVATSDGYVYQFNTSSLSPIANSSVGTDFWSSPAVYNGFLYIGDYGGSVYQLNASNVSQEIANFSTGNRVDSSPAVANGYVYVYSEDGNVYQLDASNISRQIANFTISGNVSSLNYHASSPAVSNGFVYVGSYDNDTYQLNASNISQLINRFPTSAPIESSPAVADGYIYIGSDNGYLYQLNASNLGVLPYSGCVDLTNSSTYQGYVSGDNDTTGFSVNGSIVLCPGSYSFGSVNALTVTEPNVVIDCNGSTITGNDAVSKSGISSSQFNTTVQNCNISGFYNAIYFDSTNGTIISNNLSSDQSAGAILLAGSSGYTTVQNNTVAVTGSNHIGIYVASSDNSIVSNNVSAYEQTVYTTADSNNISYNTVSGAIFALYLSSNSNIVTYNNLSTSGTQTVIFSGSGNVFEYNQVNASSFALQFSDSGNTVLRNNITSRAPWIYDTEGTGSTFNDSETGNSYYLANGSGAWTLFNIYSGAAPGYAIGGSDLPFSSTTLGSYWLGPGEDWHPWAAPYSGCVDLTNSSTYHGVVSGDNDTTGFSVNGSIVLCPGSYSFGSVNALTVTEPDVAIDCAGATLSGDNTTGMSGIYSSQSNTTIEDCDINGFSTGINFDGASNGAIAGTNASTTHDAISFGDGVGILLQGGADYDTITGSDASSVTNNGIFIHSSGDDTIIGSTGMSYSGYGIDLYSSSNDNVTDSTGVSGSSNGIWLYSGTGNIFIDSNGTSASGDGVYLDSSSGNSFSGSAGESGSSVGFALSSSDGNTFAGGQISGADATYGALEFYQGSTDDTVANSTINGDAGAYAAAMYGADSGNALVNDTLLNASTLLSLDSTSGGNTFCWDNFSDAGISPTYYVNDANGSDYFNSSLCNGEGNIWANVIDGQVGINGTVPSTGFPALFIGNSTYNDSDSLGMAVGVEDYAPLTASGSLPCTCDSGTDTITTPNYVCNLTSDQTPPTWEDCIDVEADNVTIDCGGNSISTSSGGDSVYSQSYNTTVENCDISGFDDGIQLDGSTNGTLTDNTLYSNYMGVYLGDGSDNNAITYNNFTDDNYGFYVNYSDNNAITYNNFTDDNYGFYVDYSDSNQIGYNNVLEAYQNYGSCPLMYAWNGTGYGFVADISGTGLLGVDKGNGTYRPPVPQDYTKISSSQLNESNGTYDLQVTEEYDEVSYLDQLALLTVDHSPDVDVYPGLVKADIGTIYTVSKNLTTPVSCLDENGNDCSAIFHEGAMTAPINSTYTIDLGNLSNATDIKLVLSGFSDWGGTTTKSIQVLNGEGRWVDAYSNEELNAPAGMPRTYVVDMTGKFPADTTNYSVRISFFNSARLDYVALDTSPQQPVTVNAYPPSYANLSYRGISATSGGEIPYPYYYDVQSPPSDFIWQTGNFTRYGDVLPLLNATDDEYVIMHFGDEISVQFPYVSMQNSSDVRDFILYSYDYYKSPKHVNGTTVDPLPFQNMSDYPYPANESYPYAAHLPYLSYYDNRTYGASHTPNSLSRSTAMTNASDHPMPEAAISLPFSSDNAIFDNNISGSNVGMFLFGEYSTDLVGNNISDVEEGVLLDDESMNCTVSNNTIDATGGAGIVVEDGSDSNQVSDNTVYSNNSGENCGTGYSDYCGALVLDYNDPYSYYQGEVDGNVFDDNVLNATDAFGVALDDGNFNNFTSDTIANSVDDDYPDIYLTDGSGGNTFLHNNITSDYWVDDESGSLNLYNDSTSGNIYYEADGTPSWDVYNITSSNNSGWADSGSDLPFSSYTQVGSDGYWTGSGEDWHPKVAYSGCINLSDPSTYQGNIAGDLSDGFVVNGSITLCTDVYSLPGDIVAMNVTEPNVTVDCDGATLIGDNLSSNLGIYSNQSGTTITNCNLDNFSTGILLDFNASGYTIAGNNISSDNTEGFEDEMLLSIPSGIISAGSGGVIENNDFNTPIVSVVLVEGANNTVSYDNAEASTPLGVFGGENDTFSSDNATTNGLITEYAGVYMLDGFDNGFYNVTFNITDGWGIRLENSEDNTFLGDTIQAPVWIYDDTGNNTFNDSTSGNTYYEANGTPSWDVYNIVDVNGDGWADVGSDLPFNGSLSGGEWEGYSADWHPYTTVRCVDLTNSSTYQDMISGDMADGFNVTSSITLCPGTYNFSGVTALTVTEPQITIDCLGSSINDTVAGEGNGIDVRANGATVMDCSISNFDQGISSAASANVTITSDNVSNSSSAAISGFNGNSWIHVTDDLLYGNGVGILLGAVHEDDVISDNQIYNTTTNAMVFSYMDNATVSNNTIYNVSGGPGLCGCSYGSCPDPTCGEGIRADDITNSSFTDNTITYTFASGIGFVDSEDNLVSDGEIGFANHYYYINWTWIQVGGGIWYESSSTNNTATGVYMHNDTGGAFDVQGDYNTIEGNNLNSNCGGVQQIDCNGASNLVISGNNITNGTGNGINAYSCANMNVTANHIDGNAQDGLDLYGSDNAWVQGNTFINNSYDALYVDSDSNTFLGNTFEGSVWVDDYGTNNSYNDSTSGNIYYLANGTPSWEVYNITSSNNTGWADTGSDLPFNSTTQVGIDGYWSGNGADYHPYAQALAILSDSIFPPALVNGSDATLYINASGAASVWANVTRPDGSSDIVSLTNGANTSYSDTSLVGVYNATFEAGNTVGTAVNSTQDQFETFPPLAFNVTTVDVNSSGINSTFGIYYDGILLGTNSSQDGSYLLGIPDTMLDLEFTSFANQLDVLLMGVNASEFNNRTFGMDMFTLPGYLVTYAVNNSYNFTNATVSLSYNGTNYTNTSYLHLFKCELWNFTARSCYGSWVDVTADATLNTTTETFTYVTFDFSAFSIQQGSAPAPPQPPSSGGAGGGGGGGGEGGGGGGGTVAPTGNVTLVHPITPENACTLDSDCNGSQVCLGGTCKAINGTCGFASNHTWNPYQCCSDAMCPSGSECSNNSCVVYKAVPPVQPVETMNETVYAQPCQCRLFGVCSPNGAPLWAGICWYDSVLAALAAIIIIGFAYRMMKIGRGKKGIQGQKGEKMAKASKSGEHAKHNGRKHKALAALLILLLVPLLHAQDTQTVGLLHPLFSSSYTIGTTNMTTYYFYIVNQNDTPTTAFQLSLSSSMNWFNPDNLTYPLKPDLISGNSPSWVFPPLPPNETAEVTFTVHANVALPQNIIVNSNPLSNWSGECASLVPLPGQNRSERYVSSYLASINRSSIFTVYYESGNLSGTLYSLTHLESYDAFAVFQLVNQSGDINVSMLQDPELIGAIVTDYAGTASPQPTANVTEPYSAILLAKSSKTDAENQCFNLTGMDHYPCTDNVSCRLACFSVQVCYDMSQGWDFINAILDYHHKVDAANAQLDSAQAAASNFSASPSYDSAGALLAQFDSLNRAETQVIFQPLMTSYEFCQTPDYSLMQQMDARRQILDYMDSECIYGKKDSMVQESVDMAQMFQGVAANPSVAAPVSQNAAPVVVKVNTVTVTLPAGDGCSGFLGVGSIAGTCLQWWLIGIVVVLALAAIVFWDRLVPRKK
jgi:parallel beta-helix repeat protein